jgi:type IV pilus assembly protein PilQ
MLLALVIAAPTAAGPTSTTSSAPKVDNLITALDVVKEQHYTRVVLRAKKTPTFTVFKLKDPDRLVVDVLHTDLDSVDAPKEVNDSRIGRIATTQFKQAGHMVSRFIIGLKAGVRFGAKAEGMAVVVTISDKDYWAQAEKEPAKSMARLAKKDLPPPEQDNLGVQPKVKPLTDTRPKKSESQAKKDHRIVESHGTKSNPLKVAIRRIDVSDVTDIKILSNRKIKNYEILEVFEPFRIVVDIFGATMKPRKFEKTFDGQYLDRLRAVQFGGKVRIVMDCDQGKRQSYRIQKSIKGLRIRFAAQKQQPVVATKKEETTKPVKVAPAKVAETKKKAAPKVVKVAEAKVQPAPVEPKKELSVLKDLNFTQDSSQARIVLDLAGEANPKVVHADDRSTVLEIPDCKMPLMLERTLDTSEFGGNIQSLSAYRVRGEKKVKLVAVTNKQISNRFERRDGKLHWVFDTTKPRTETSVSTAKLDNNNESISYNYAPDQVAGYSVQRPDMQAAAEGGKKKRKYRGKRISLDFKDADIHNILRLISEVARLNIITSDAVAGNITINMRNVPWDQALDIILKTKKLGKVRHGNIIRVAPLEELAAETKMAREAAEARRTLEPLRVRLIPVNYSTADALMAQVQGVLSERGSVTIDTRTNVLIVKDVLENLIKAEGLVRSLDTETPQVLIEARIVEANTQFIREIGVQWGGDLNFTDASGNPTGLGFPNNISVSGGADGAQTNTAISGTANPGQFAINMPAAVGAGSGGALGFIFGSANGAAHLNLRLSALENRGAVKIVSAPKITTLDNNKAKISQGVSIPISVVSAAGVNTQFVEARLVLEVTPHITQEGSILMAIKVNKNEPDFSRTGARGDPTILKKEAETQVMVKDGDTTVIGGIYTRKTSDTYAGVPILSRIPVLGWFFRNVKKGDDRTELLIFITPRIVNRLKATVTQG